MIVESLNTFFMCMCYVRNCRHTVCNSFVYIVTSYVSMYSQISPGDVSFSELAHTGVPTGGCLIGGRDKMAGKCNDHV